MHIPHHSNRLYTALICSLLTLPIIGSWSPLTAAAQGACHEAVQGKIAWDYKGHKRWNRKNIASLCKGAEDSTQPARCFNRVMHGGVDWGGGERWQWKNAIKLCQGTDNARARIACFTDKIDAGTKWSAAISACKGSRGKQRAATVAVPHRRAAGAGGDMTRVPDSGESGSGSNPTVRIDPKAMGEYISKQMAEGNKRRDSDCRQVSLMRGHIKLDSAAAGGDRLRLKGCLGQPDPGDVQVWIRWRDRIAKGRTHFYRTSASMEAPEIALRDGAKVTLVRTKGGETHQLTPWIAINQVRNTDRDGDGHLAGKWGGDDCDDSDPNTFPGNAEVADPGHDEDCDPTTIDSGTRLHAASGDGDKDKDTFVDVNVGNYGHGNYISRDINYHVGHREGRALVYGTDCDDSRADVHPQQIEVCNGRDDNCDGNVDEGLRNCK